MGDAGGEPAERGELPLLGLLGGDGLVFEQDHGAARGAGQRREVGAESRSLRAGAQGGRVVLARGAPAFQARGERGRAIRERGVAL